ncbi:hypothetical protein JW979_02295 [bacterium]|nr:hypothetical protein [candidate division CSSED10-310 bacterium]
MIKKNGLKRITIRGFRRSNYNLLFEAFASIKEVQDRLVHAEIQTAMKFYAKVTEIAKSETADKNLPHTLIFNVPLSITWSK